MGLEFELRLNNDPRAMNLVEAFIREVIRHAPLAEPADLQALIAAAVGQVIARAYLPAETGLIILHSKQSGAALEFSIRDFGFPKDIAKLESALQGRTAGMWTGELQHTDAADAIWWEGHGPDGKTMFITKSLHDSHITEQGADLTPFHPEPPLAPAQEYAIRRMQPADAITISQLIYKAYGSSYFNRDVYYPERVAAENASGSIISFVAESASGEIVGHYALERNQDGPVAEGGQAVVDPAHRGRKLLDRLKTAAIAHAREIGLAGVFGDAVTVHTFTQKANIAMGAKLCCADLGISPKSETFRGIAAPPSPQRVSCLLYFLPFRARPGRTVHVPPVYQEAVKEIVERLDGSCVFGDPSPPSGAGVLRVQLHASSATAFLTAARIGIDTFAALRKATRELIDHGHAEAIFVDLPIGDPATAGIVSNLRKIGYSFAGIAPDFLADGDSFRMIYLIDDLSVDNMKIEESSAMKLVEFALADRKQVVEEMP